MNNFEKKIKKMKEKLETIVSIYGRDNYRTFELIKKIKLYESVSSISHKEMGDNLTQVGGYLTKVKAGYYNKCEPTVNEDKQLLKVLTERIKAEKKERKQELKNNSGSLVEIGHCVDDIQGGMEC